jgi:hypothetical protein
MPGAAHANRVPSLCRRNVRHTRGYDPVLWHDKAIPAQGRACASVLLLVLLANGRLVNSCVSFCLALQSALRQAVYLAIKELATTAEDVIMVTSSIMKDMQPNSEVIYRPNAIRALCRIIDVRLFRWPLHALRY